MSPLPESKDGGVPSFLGGRTGAYAYGRLFWAFSKVSSVLESNVVNVLGCLNCPDYDLDPTYDAIEDGCLQDTRFGEPQRDRFVESHVHGGACRIFGLFKPSQALVPAERFELPTA